MNYTVEVLSQCTHKQAALLIVFVAYLVSVFFFGLGYFLLYLRKQTHFIFAGDISESRLSEEKLKVKDRLQWLLLLLDYFEHFASDHRKVSRDKNDQGIPRHFISLMAAFWCWRSI